MDYYREFNKIFCCNNLDTLEKLTSLECYFFDQHKVPSFSLPAISNIPNNTSINMVQESSKLEEPKYYELPKVLVEKNERIQKPVTSTSNAEWFEPAQSDTLFWCVYTFVKGYSDYLMIGSKYANYEIEEKQKLFAFFKKCPKILKTTNCKITNAQTEEILSEMVGMQEQISFLGIIALVVYYRVNILLVHDTKKMYLSFCLADDEETTQKTCVLYKHHKYAKRYKMRMYEEDTETISTIKNSMLCLESYMKPLRAISTYKVSELEEIAQKIGMEMGEGSLKKHDLYTKIQEYCVWQ